MAAKDSSFRRMCLVLLIVSVVSATLLALVYSVTRGPIVAKQQAQTMQALRRVLPGIHGEFVKQEVFLPTEKEPVTVYKVMDGDKMSGAAVETYTDKGFAGAFRLAVGFDSCGTILGSEVLQSSETPGLGDKIKSEKSDFPAQFVGQNPESYSLKVTKDGGQVNAITAATISSRAYCDAVDRAYRAFLLVKEGKNE